MNVYARALLSSDKGKGAIFIRHFMEYLSEQDGPVELRIAQEVAMAKVCDLTEEGISLNYVKACGRSLQEAELIVYARRGKNYTAEITDQGDDWLRHLPETYGVKLSDRGKANTAADPGAMVEVQERPNRRFKAGQEIDHHVWKAYWTAYRAGDLDLLFLEPDLKVKLRRPEK